MRCDVNRADRFFFFNDTATTEIYTLSLHDALPISATSPCIEEMDFDVVSEREDAYRGRTISDPFLRLRLRYSDRSEEHTSELQSRQYLVCRLLLEKKKNTNYAPPTCYAHFLHPILP